MSKPSDVRSGKRRWPAASAPAASRVMEIRLKKGRDGRDSLACHRHDGTATWSALHPFQPIHDLTHYAVETTLGLTEAFFGLLARGWAITDFEDKAQIRLMPAEALYAEIVVGLLDLERIPGTQRSWDHFSESVASALAGHGVAPARDLTPDLLDAIRARRSALVAQWARLRPGETLTLRFPD